EQADRRDDEPPIGRAQRGAQALRIDAAHQQEQQHRADAEADAESQHGFHAVASSASVGRTSRGNTCSRAKNTRPRPVTSTYWTTCDTSTRAHADCAATPSPCRAAVPKSSWVPT